MFAAFEPNDLRKDVSATKGVIGADGKPVTLSTTGVTSSSKKYMAPLKVNNDSPANWKVIRYADVLLMLAEAMNENGKTTEALTYLNQVRQRAGLSGYTGLTKDEFREKVYLERRLELFLQGHRWFDLVRTGRALAVVARFGMKPYMTVFPIPLTELEIIRNPAVFAQNPGYE